MNVQISQIEFFLPETRVTNDDLAAENPDWDFKLIEPKTGIRCRHIAGPEERASDLAVKAAERLFEKSGIARESIDVLLLCTQSPDHILPTTACILQNRLGLPTSTASFDVNLGCSAFVYGLSVSSAMIESGQAKRVLLLCAETYSKYIAPSDRASRTVFGDGAAATILEPATEGKSIGPFVFGTDGAGCNKIIVRETPADAHVDEGAPVMPRQRLTLEGASVFMFTMKRVPECVGAVLEKAGKTMMDVDLVVFHQASKVVIDNLVRILNLDESKVFRGFRDIGNTVSASIPIALKQAQEQNRLCAGQTVLLVGFGVGLSWGACLVQW